MNQSIEQELIKRYSYLSENKKLILALCINFETEKNYYKKQIEKNISLYKRMKKYNNEDELLKLLKDGIKYYKSELTIKRPYLLKNVSKNIILMFEEFLLGDLEVEDTQLFKHIESVKNNMNYSESFYSLIDQLEDRRKRNQHLKNIPTFTVWKILDYVRNKYSCNKIVLDALDKYYNLDRFTIANDDCEYGYIIPESIEMSDYPDSSLYVGCIDSMVISTYKGNEFEREDSYFNYNFEEKFEYDSEEYLSKFAYDLAKCEFVKNKKDVLKLSYKCRAKTINE